MENLPEKNNQRGITSIPSNRAVNIAEKLLDVNMLINYKMEGDELMEWAMELDRLLPFEEIEKLPFILDMFKTTALEYEHKEGIRNIFNALRIVRKVDGKFVILKAIW